jgi:hypothetical protein
LDGLKVAGGHATAVRAEDDSVDRRISRRPVQCPHFPTACHIPEIEDMFVLPLVLGDPSQPAHVWAHCAEAIQGGKIAQAQVPTLSYLIHINLNLTHLTMPLRNHKRDALVRSDTRLLDKKTVWYASARKNGLCWRQPVKVDSRPVLDCQ